MNRITFIRTALVFIVSASAFTVLNGCLKSSTSPETAKIPLASFNITGNWYVTETPPGPYHYNYYLNISATDSLHYAIGVELNGADTIQIFMSRLKVEKYLGKNLFLAHKKSGKGNAIDIDFLICHATPTNTRCPAHDDTLDIGGVFYLEKVGSTLRDAGAKTYIGDGSRALTGKFYNLAYLGNHWNKNSTVSFEIKNGMRTTYENNGTPDDSGTITTTASTFTYEGGTSQYVFIGDTLYVYGNLSQGYENRILNYQPSDKAMPGQLFQ